MSELAPETPVSVTVAAEPQAVPEMEETALAAGAALSQSGEARAEASTAAADAQAAAEQAGQARAEAATAEAEAIAASAVAQTADEKLNRLIEMTQPLYDDYATRRAEAEAAAQAIPEVTEVDATGAGDTGTAGAGSASGGTSGDSDNGSDNGSGTEQRPRRGLRHRK